jgi:LysR family transcriptional regulator, cell division regulator
MIPSPSDLHYFMEVTHTLNLSRAAERLGISQPSLSLSIQRLESAVGVPLLIRTKSGVRLTHAGLRFQGEARSLISSWENIRSATLKDESEVGGRYILGCHPSVALYTLPRFLPELLLSYPALEIKLVHDLSRKITEDVISFRIDFGLVINPIPHPDLVLKPLSRDEVTVWTGPGNLPAQTLGSDEAVLICDPNLIQSEFVVKQLAQKGVRFRRTIPSSSLELITELVASGAGLGILPEKVATRVPAFKLKRAGKDLPRYHDHLSLAYRVDSQKSLASKIIARHIEKACRVAE